MIKKKKRTILFYSSFLKSLRKLVEYVKSVRVGPTENRIEVSAYFKKRVENYFIGT